jgi:hypothetical protein
MKAETGAMSKAMIRSGISFDRSPNEQKPREPSANGKLKNNFAGTAKKKNRKDKVAQRSLVAVEEKESASGSNEDIQHEFGGVATVIKPQKHLSPRSINAHPQMVGLKCHDFDLIQQVKESDASVGSRESLDEVEAHFSIDGSCTRELFGTPEIQGPCTR